MPYRLCQRCGHPFYSNTTHVRPGGPPGLGLECADCRIAAVPPMVVPQMPEDRLYKRCRLAILANRCICLGERHEEAGMARRMLIKYMQQFSEMGVVWIGLEAPCCFQDDINDGSVGGIELFNGLKGKNPGLGEVGGCAHGFGIDVVCYDYDCGSKGGFAQLLKILPSVGALGRMKDEAPKFSTTAGGFQHWINKYRLPVMDYFAACQLRALARFHQRHILLVGADHFKSTQGLKSFPDQLPVPYVLFDTTL